jgi:hypothetical protein
MKELENHKSDKVSVANQRQVETHKLVQEMKKCPGHKVWELDVAEGVIREAKIERVDAEVGKHGTKIRNKVIQREGCLYVPALNARNADKKFIKMLAVNDILTAMKR